MNGRPQQPLDSDPAAVHRSASEALLSCTPGSTPLEVIPEAAA